MKSNYQVIFIGENSAFYDNIVSTFRERVNDLGLPANSINILTEENFFTEYKPYNPSVCIYFGILGLPKNLDILDNIIEDAVFVIPVVPEVQNFPKYVPKQLLPINGFPLRALDDIEALVARMMEGLSLLRLARRLFVSYRRVESRSVAIQLYEYLDQCGFDVFLDTHSIRPGEQFQDELWHRLVDTDVVVLLDTPGFLGSEWTEQELAKASAMSIGILQLVWPNHKQNPYSSLCDPIYLNQDDFEGGNYTGSSINLTNRFLKHLSGEVESKRARNLAARQDNLIQEFTTTARNMNVQANLQPEKYITISNLKGQEFAIIPTVGVPHAFTYNQTEELIKRIRSHNSPKAFLLYDNRNVVEKWQKHLTWLDDYLPVQAVRVTEIEKCIKYLQA